MSSAESRQHHLSDYATMQFKHHSTSSLPSDRFLTVNSLQYSHNPPQFRTSSPLTDQRYEQQDLGFTSTDHQPSMFTMNMHGHHTADSHPELLSSPSTSSISQFQQQPHGDQRWMQYSDNARYDYLSPSVPANYHSSYPAASSYPAQRLEPPLHEFRQTHQTHQSQQIHSGSGVVSNQGAQRLCLAGSLDPTTGVFYRTPEHPRLRTAQACEKCRTRKAKCSGEHPSCKRCLTRGLICQYAKEGRVRGPNKPKGKSSASASSTPESSAKATSSTADSPPPSTDLPNSRNDTSASRKSRRDSLSLGESRASRPRPPDLQLQTTSNRFRAVPHQGYTEAGIQDFHDYPQSSLSSSDISSGSTGQSLSQASTRSQTSQSASQFQSHLSQHHMPLDGNGEQESSPSIPRSAGSSTFSQRDNSPASASTGIASSDGLSAGSIQSASSISPSDNMISLASGIPSAPEYHLNMPESRLEYGVEMGTPLPHARMSTGAPFSLVHTQNSSPHGVIQHTQYQQHHPASYHLGPQQSRSQSNTLRFSADAGMH